MFVFSIYIQDVVFTRNPELSVQLSLNKLPPAAFIKTLARASAYNYYLKLLGRFNFLMSPLSRTWEAKRNINELAFFKP